MARSPFLHSGLQVAVVVLELDAEREGVFLALKTRPTVGDATRSGESAKEIEAYVDRWHCSRPFPGVPDADAERVEDQHQSLGSRYSVVAEC